MPKKRHQCVVKLVDICARVCFMEGREMSVDLTDGRNAFLLRGRVSGRVKRSGVGKSGGKKEGRAGEKEVAKAKEVRVERAKANAASGARPSSKEISKSVHTAAREG